MAAADDGLAKAVGEKGKVADVIHDQTTATGIGRRDGFLYRIKKAYPNIEVVDLHYPADRLKGADNSKAMLQVNSNMVAIFASNEGSAIGLAVSLKESGFTVAGVGFDSCKAQKDAILDATPIGAVTLNPVGIGGYDWVAMRLKSGKIVEVLPV